MATYLAEAELADPKLVHEPVMRSLNVADTITTGEGGGSPARGIMIAALISAPFWALVAFTIYLLL
jgi:hypothetical protein